MSNIEDLKKELALVKAQDSKKELSLVFDRMPKEPVSVQEYFSFLQTNLDDYENVLLDQEVANKFMKHVRSLRTGTHSVVPLLCPGGNRCPIVKQCPFAKWLPDETLDPNSKFPVLKPCPIEKIYLSNRIESYVVEFDADVNSPSTMAIITKLAELDIYELRINIQLSSGDRFGEGSDLLQETVESLNPVNGKATYSLRVHPLVELKEKITKQKQLLLESLIATPEKRFKARTQVVESEKQNDLINQMSDLKKKLSDLTTNRSAKVIDVTPPYTEE